MSKKLLPVGVFAKIGVKRALRNPVALFFMFLFPLIFLFVFGGIFGRGGDASFRVALINQSNEEFTKQFIEKSKEGKLLKIEEADSLDGAKEKMTRGQVDAAIVLPESFGRIEGGIPRGEAKIHYTQNNAQAAQTLTTVLQGQFQAINGQFVKADTPFKVSSEQLNAKGLDSFDYTFAGLLGFSIIGAGIFGPVNVFPELKKQGVLRRLHITPLRTWQYFLSNVVAQAVTGLMSLALMFAVAMVVFKLKLVGNPIELVVFLTLSIAMVLGIGLAVGGWARDEQQAAPLANIVVFPMMFLSGTFFPRFLMPEWLQTASAALPLTPVIEGVRLIVNEGKHLIDLGPQLGLVGLWLVVIYIIAFRVFRWE